MVNRLMSPRQAVIAGTEQTFHISAVSSDYDSIFVHESNDPVVSTNTADDENPVPSLGEIMRKLRKEDPAQFQRLIKDDTRD